MTRYCPESFDLLGEEQRSHSSTSFQLEDQSDLSFVHSTLTCNKMLKRKMSSNQKAEIIAPGMH